MKKNFYLFGVLLLGVVIFSLIDFNVDGFDFLKFQVSKYYFQSWIAMAGAVFSLIMSITIFIIYKKSDLISLKFISISFLLISSAYGVIGYHTSYCKICSDLSLCGASHTYPNYFIVIALVIFVLGILLVNLNKNLRFLKLFSYGLIFATLLLMIILFLSLEFMETPDITNYILINLNLQGFTFVFPLVFIGFAFFYMRSIYRVTNSIILIFVLIFVSFIPQAYHIFICDECQSMECSEFYIFSGFLIFLAVGLFIYSMSLELDKKDALE